MRNKRPVKEAKVGSRSQKLNGPLGFSGLAGVVKAVRRCAQKEVQASLDGRLGELGGMEGPDEITLPRSRRAGRKKEGPGQLGSWGNVG